MTILNNILAFILIGFSFYTYGQGDTKKKKYETEVCVYKNSKEKSKVIMNEKRGISDTATAFISGTIYDSKKRPFGFAALYLQSLTDSSQYGVITDSFGNFKLHLPAGMYKLTALCVGFESLIVNKLLLEKGEVRELKLQLGSTGAFITYYKRFSKPPNEQNLRKIKKLNRKI